MSSVIMYTKQTCGYCYRAKHLLDRKNVEYIEIAIDYSAEERNKMIELTAGYTVPQIIIDDQPIGGCDELYALEYNNQLDEMLRSNSNV